MRLLPVVSIIIIVIVAYSFLAIFGFINYETLEGCKESYKFRPWCFSTLAIQNRDVSICEEMIPLLEQAEDGYNQLPNSPITYSQIINQKVNECKNNFYEEVPKTGFDIGLCNSAGNYSITCFTAIALNLNDPLICDNIETEPDWGGTWWAGSGRNTCIQKVAWKLVDPSICERIDFESLRESCISDINEMKNNCQRIILDNPPECGDGICTKEEDCYTSSECFDGTQYIKNCPYGCPKDCNWGLDYYKCVSDSDGGINIEEKGYIKTTKYDYGGNDQCMTKVSSGGYRGIPDECSGDTCYLSEYYCDGDRVAEEKIPCPSGCKEGACP